MEKPLATTVADAARVLAAWRRLGAHRDDGIQLPLQPDSSDRRVRALPPGPSVNRSAVRTVFATPRRAIPDWKQQRDTGGGVLLDLAVHHIDLVRFLLDTEIAHVSAEIRSTTSDQDTAFLQLRLTNGVAAQSMCSLSAIEEDRIEIYGSNAQVTIDRYRSLRAEETPASAGGALSGAVDPFAWRDAGSALRAREAPRPTARSVVSRGHERVRASGSRPRRRRPRRSVTGFALSPSSKQQSCPRARAVPSRSTPRPAA